MKKVIFKTGLILLLSIISITLFSQDVDSLSTTQQVTEVERIFDKYSAKAVDGLNNAVQNVAPYAEKGFHMAVRLQIAKGIVNIIPLPLTLLFVWLLFRTMKRLDDIEQVKKDTGENISEIRAEIYKVTLVVSAIVGIVGIIACFFTVGDGILYLIAPEWYAVQDILQLF